MTQRLPPLAQGQRAAERGLRRCLNVCLHRGKPGGRRFVGVCAFAQLHSPLAQGQWDLQRGTGQCEKQRAQLKQWARSGS